MAGFNYIPFIQLSFQLALYTLTCNFDILKRFSLWTPFLLSEFLICFDPFGEEEVNTYSDKISFS